MTLTGPADFEEEIKKSRFIARAAPVSSPEAAREFLDRVREPKATHNCWAFKIGAAYRFSDDGEPGGTAGRPMLGAIERQGIDQVMVVVTRYFGGIKLGAGGLARAYGGAVASCLRLAETKEVRPFVTVTINTSFEWIGQVQHLIDRHGGERQVQTYSATGASFTVRIDAAETNALGVALAEATRGASELVVRD